MRGRARHEPVNASTYHIAARRARVTTLVIRQLCVLSAHVLLAWLASVHADLAQDPLVLAPEGFHAHMQVEKDAGPEESLELLAGRSADPLDHVAAPADHNRLLRFAVDDNRAVQPR